DFFGTAYGQHGEVFDGFKFGDANVQLDDTLLLIEPETAKQYETMHLVIAPSPGGGGTATVLSPGTILPGVNPTHETPVLAPGSKSHTFIGTVDVNAATAKMRLVQIA